MQTLALRSVALSREYLSEITEPFSNNLKLDIAGCRVKDGRARFGQEFDLQLAKLKGSADTFEWLGKPRPRRLVLCLKPNEPYMAFKYSRYVTQSI